MSDTILDISVLKAEPEETYHAQAGRYLSSHLLADFRRCPLLYWRKVCGLIPDADRPAYVVGRAAHKRILEGREAYEAAYAVGGPINPRTDRPFGPGTKAFASWAAAHGKPVLTDSQADLVEQMSAGVAMNARATELLMVGRAEGVVRADYCGVPCQARLDWAHPLEGLVDLKTCDELTWFEADARRYGYLYQMAFYRAVLARALNDVLVPVHIIAVEKSQPYRCGVWRVPEDSLAIAQAENEAAIRRLARCRDLGQWPTGYEEMRLLHAT
jgi:hypothetical protein